MLRHRNWFFFLVLGSILFTTYLVIKVAKGYKIDLDTKSFEPTGLLVATSTPDGAQLYVNGKLKSATNTTVSLDPGQYNVEIKKDGFHPWFKTLKLERELVTKTDAYLFPLLPDLKAITYSGANNPSVSPDDSKVIYSVDSFSIEGMNGLWMVDLNDLPFGISREPRQILKSSLKGVDFGKAVYQWSPDSKQILVTINRGKTEINYLLDSSSLINESLLTDVTVRVPQILKQWELEKRVKYDQKIKKVPPELAHIIKESTTSVSFSPDETKLMYTATASATLADKYKPAINGASSQKQERTIKPNRVYVYDIKEDRNFFVAEVQPLPEVNKKNRVPTPTPSPTFTLNWFPTSKHLMKVENNKVSVMDYDGTNEVIVYPGPFVNLFAFPFPGGNKILVLTTISAATEAVSNLYAVVLR